MGYANLCRLGLLVIVYRRENTPLQTEKNCLLSFYLRFEARVHDLEYVSLSDP
jgi:hypothetical protein